MSISNYYEDVLLGQLPSPCWLALHTGDAGETGANEATGGSYQRQSVTLNTSSGGHRDNSNAVLFSGMPAGTFGGTGRASLWDAQSSGNCLWVGDSTQRTLLAGDAYSVNIGDIDVTLE